METLNFIYEFRRMCKSIDCSECGVYRCCTESNIPACLLAMKAKPEDVVRIVEEWSKANPVQTNNNKFKEVFGIDFRKLLFDTSANRTLWLNKPYELPKAGAEKKTKECKAHPTQMNIEKFRETFGVIPIAFTANQIGLSSDWWNAPYEAPNYEE